MVTNCLDSYSRMPKLPSRKRILQLKAATEANITDVGAKVVARGTNLLSLVATSRHISPTGTVHIRLRVNVAVILVTVVRSRCQLSSLCSWTGLLLSPHTLVM